MTRHPHLKHGKLLASLGGCILAAAVVVGTATARTSSVASCPSYSMSRPFLPWLDQGSYFLAPGGSFESKPSPWKLGTGTSIVKGNEPWHVTSPSDRYELSIAAGSYATSPAVCVTVYSPDLRLFVQNTGSPTSRLEVDINYTNTYGKPATKPIAYLAGTSAWSLSPQLLFLQYTAPLVGGQGQTWVSFTFRPSGYTSSWQIDDVYVDPLKHQ